jgi:hypothetical protein
VKEIGIYVEGGGDTAQQKAELRNGFDQLLNAQKQAARAKRLGWKLVPSGGRHAAYNDFFNAVGQAGDDVLCILLVDSEEQLPPELPKAQDESREDRKQRTLANAIARRDHLTNRDNWDLSEILPEQVHLMVRCMEAWIVSDRDRLTKYYGQGFHARSLPARSNLDDEPKQSLYDKLQRATRNTSKGEYAKIKHASKLLALIDPHKVAVRCPRFKTFTDWLSEQIQNA